MAMSAELPVASTQTSSASGHWVLGRASYCVFQVCVARAFRRASIARLKPSRYGVVKTALATEDTRGALLLVTINCKVQQVRLKPDTTYERQRRRTKTL